MFLSFYKLNHQDSLLVNVCFSSCAMVLTLPLAFYCKPFCPTIIVLKCWCSTCWLLKLGTDSKMNCSFQDLANAGATKRPTCCVLVQTKPTKGEIGQEEQEKLKGEYDQVASDISELANTMF